MGDLRLAFATDEDVVKGHAQWWRSDTKEKIDTQNRKDLGASFAMGGGGPVLSAWVAEKCNRAPGQELAEAEERVHADLSRETKDGGVEARDRFKVLSAAKIGTQPEETADTRRASSQREADGGKKVKARSAATVYQDPDLRYGHVDIAGRGRRRSSRFRAISLGALNFEDAFLRADGFDRGGFLRAPCEWNSRDYRRFGDCGHRRIA